jgi:hypothetical protein
MYAGAVKEAGDPEHPHKLHFLSFMVMELLGPSVGHLSLELQTYTTNANLLVNHGLGMLKVSTQGPPWADARALCWP